MLWTDEADALLIKLWDDGLSAKLVANEMAAAGYNITRYAVIGRRHRLTRAAFKRNNYPDMVVNKNYTPLKTRRSKPVTEPAPPEPIAADRPDRLASNPGVYYLDNPPDGCKALLDKRGGQWNLLMCCGRRRGYDYNGAKSPYCPAHFRLYVNEQAARRTHG